MASIVSRGAWTDISVTVNPFEHHAQTEAPTSPKCKKSQVKTQSMHLHAQDAIFTAKVNANVGTDIFWDVEQLDHEGSTSGGETTDSDLSFSDADSPKVTFLSPPGLSLPGFESSTDSSADSTPKAMPQRQKVQFDKVAKMPETTQGSDRRTTPLHLLLNSRLVNSCDNGVADLIVPVNDFKSSESGSIEMVSLGPVTLQLSTDMKMFIKTEFQTESVFARVNCIQVCKDGVALVIGTLQYSATEATRIEGRIEELLLDVRVAVDDEPKMVSILGAQMKKGCVVRIFAKSSTGEIYCDVCYRDRHEEVELTCVVAELRELEALRRDTNLLRYQRQLNSMMVGSLRRRRLGLEC